MNPTCKNSYLLRNGEHEDEYDKTRDEAKKRGFPFFIFDERIYDTVTEEKRGHWDDLSEQLAT